MKRMLVTIQLVLLLLACRSTNYFIRTNSLAATGDIVTVVSVSESTIADYNTIQHNLLAQQAPHTKLYHYRVQDKHKRLFDIFEFAPQADFPVNSCLIRWRDEKDNTYPRLSDTGPHCSLLPTEPITNKIATNQQPTHRLARVAQLNRWLDKNESSLITAWGKPSSINTTGSSRTLIYRYKYSVSGQSGHQRYTSVWHCQTHWYIKNGVVQHYKETGNACY